MAKKKEKQKKSKKGERAHLWGGKTGNVREENYRERNSDFSLRSTEFGWSSRIGPRLKVGVLGEGYTWILETPSFSKVSHRRFEESKASGSERVRRTSLGRCSHFKR